MKLYKNGILFLMFAVLCFFVVEVSAKGGPPFFLKQYRKGDNSIGVLYINGDGLGTGKSITPKVMRISVARPGKILYQMAFFTKSEEFTLNSGETVHVGGQNPIKGVILFSKDETKKEASHQAALLGEMKIGEDFLAYFTGWIIYAEEQNLEEYRGWSINNKILKEGNEVILKGEDKILITDNLLGEYISGTKDRKQSPAKTLSCEDDCKGMFERGELRKGITAEECIKVLCK